MAKLVAVGVALVGVAWTFDVPGSGPNGATIRYAFSGQVGRASRRITGSVTGTDSTKTWPA